MCFGIGRYYRVFTVENVYICIRHKRTSDIMYEKVNTLFRLNNVVPTVSPAILEAASTMAQYQSQIQMIDTSWVQHFARIQEVVEPMVESYRRIQEALAPTLESYNRRIEAMSGSLLEAATQRQQEIAKLAAGIELPITKMQLQMESYNKATSATIAKLSSVMETVQVEWAKNSAIYIEATKPLIHFAEQWDTGITNALRSLANVHISLPEMINAKVLRELSRFVADEEYTFDDVEISDDGELIIAGEQVQQNELKEGLFLDVLNRINESIAVQSGLIRRQNEKLTIQEETINILMLEVGKLKNSKLKWFLLNIILPIILGILINNLASPLLKSYTDIPVQQVKKMMKIATTESAIEPATLTNHRYVTTSTLKIWAGGYMKSPVIYYINQGDIVRVLNKRRNWTYVLYIDRNTGEVITGWTLTRYLKAFK